MPLPVKPTGLAITNPLVLYRSLVATRAIDPDPAQHRLALHLQLLYEQLKDYEPIVQYGYRLQEIGRTIGRTPVQQQNAESRNKSKSFISALLGEKKKRENLALTRVLTSHEEALKLNSPKGLMLHGEVGTGKSMLIDLFADCLPNRKKKRWHFTTFMLETLSKLEQLRRSRQMIIPSSLGQQDDYSLLWLARELISTSPILFLDEFQLPDRAASKIMSNLMTSFFQLGGVLIATSNRMPEELAKASGMEFAPPPSRLESPNWKLGIFGRGAKGRSDNMFSGQNEFAGFLELLRARCEVWEMDSKKDYRRDETESEPRTHTDDHELGNSSNEGHEGFQSLVPGNIGLGYEQSLPTDEPREFSRDVTVTLPKYYFIKPGPASSSSHVETWSETYKVAQLAASSMDPNTTDDIPWSPGSMSIYGRKVWIPRQFKDMTSWTFEELCGSPLGPADYITLASSYSTLVLSDVPVLSLLQKNEARRFITLLDALYEPRCKLIISSDAGPDDIFFPEADVSVCTDHKAAKDTSESDAVYPETFSEVYQDATSPFRPNVSMYASPEPDYTHARLAGMLAEGQLEDGPPNTLRRGDVILAHDQDVTRPGPNFAQIGSFTGEDERFAFKRAKSRLWEMCGSKWWARNEEGWWRPIDKSARHWETPCAPAAESQTEATAMADSSEGMGASREVNQEQDEVMFKHGASPFRTRQDPPPKFSWAHAWGMQTWGKKAGAWGRGVEGLDQRKKSKEKK